MFHSAMKTNIILYNNKRDSLHYVIQNLIFCHTKLKDKTEYKMMKHFEIQNNHFNIQSIRLQNGIIVTYKIKCYIIQNDTCPTLRQSIFEWHGARCNTHGKIKNETIDEIYTHH